MTEPHEDVRGLNEVLDKICEIATKASAVDDIPGEVDQALSEIIALSRYKFDTRPTSGRK